MADGPQVLAEFTSMEGLEDALRRRLAEYGVAYRTYDDIACIADGLTQKLLGRNPQKKIGRKTLPTLVGSMGCKLQLVVDPKLDAIFQARLARLQVERAPRGWGAGETRRAQQVDLDRLRPEFFKLMGHKGGVACAAKRTAAERTEHARKIGRKGGKARLKKIPAEKRAEIARAAAKARWAKCTPEQREQVGLYLNAAKRRLRGT